MPDQDRRFRVGLSFPGEKRDYINLVADLLAAELGRERVLYDGYLVSELARPELDLYIARLYREETDLLVPFYCREYQQKKWCQLEWRQMRDILFRLESGRVMPFRFDDAHIDGVLSIDGYISIENRSPFDVARLILDRLGMAQPARRPPPSADHSWPDLTALAISGALKRPVGLRENVRRLERILSRRLGANPVVLGLPGIGKTSLLTEAAFLFSTTNPPVPLYNVAPEQLTESSLPDRILDVVNAYRCAIAFEDAHYWSSQRFSVLQALIPRLNGSNVRVIVSTTPAHYDALGADHVLRRPMFSPLPLSEPSGPQLRDMVRDACRSWDFRISDSALETAISLTTRYMPTEALPGKALALLDEACAYAQLPSTKVAGSVHLGSVDETLVKFVFAARVGVDVEQLG